MKKNKLRRMNDFKIFGRFGNQLPPEGPGDGVDFVRFWSLGTRFWNEVVFGQVREYFGDFRKKVDCSREFSGV